MKAAQHTPGTWRIADDNLTIMATLPNGEYSARICRPTFARDSLLIAAAPDLLAALQFCIDALAVYAGNANPRCLETMNEQARAAIAKATGG